MEFFLGEQNGERDGALLTPANSFLLLVFLRLCQFWRKSIKKCDRESAHGRIHIHSCTFMMFHLTVGYDNDDV